MTRRLVALITATGLVVVAFGVIAATRSLDAAAEQDDGVPNSDTTPTDLATVAAITGDLTESVEEIGTISGGDTWPAPIDAQGIVTDRHEKGTVVEPGETLIWIDGRPVTLARGDTPMYRVLSLTRDRDNKRLQGEDVTQLQQFLIAAGFDDKGRLEADGEFGVSTRRAVLDWQKATGLERTGSVDRTQLVFGPTALRLADEPRIGSPFSELTVGAPERTVTTALEPEQRNFVEVADTVDLDPGSGTTITGRITEIETVVGDSGSREVRVRIAPDTPLDPEIERVTVTVTRTVATDATIIPVLAVLALSGGGYGVEVVTDGTTGTTELRPIELVDVVDDLAAVTGDVDPGDELVVPTEIGGSSNNDDQIDGDTDEQSGEGS